MEYKEAQDIKSLGEEIIKSLSMFHIMPRYVYFYRSKGSKSKNTIARIHGLGGIWYEVLGRPPIYIIEVISERYDKLSKEEKEKTLIHELLHIHKGFSGGFRPHKGYINKRLVEKLHKQLIERRSFINTATKNILDNYQ